MCLPWLAACLDNRAKMVGDNIHALAVYPATDLFIASDSPWRINCTLAFYHIRRLLPRILAGVVAMTSRLAAALFAALFAEIAANLQKLMPTAIDLGPFDPNRKKRMPTNPAYDKVPSHEDCP